MFKSRVALAATLSGNYGIYNGFELLEHEPIPGKEEYLNSEKYELKVARLEQAGQHQGLHRPRSIAIRQRQSGAAADQPAALRAGRRRRGDRLRQGIVRRRQRRRGRDRVGDEGPREFWFHFGDIEIGPPATRGTRAPSRKPDHRRAAHGRMGRRAAAHRSGAGSRHSLALLFVKASRERRYPRSIAEVAAGRRRASGTRTPSSISCTSRHSPTATTTASAISTG